MTREIEGVQNPCRIEAGKTPGVLLWRKQVGRYRHINDPERIVKIGMAGQADSTAIIEVEITPEMVGKKVGVAVEFEFKRPKTKNKKGGVQTSDQSNWQRAVENVSGKYYIITSVKQFRETVQKIKSGVF